MDMCKRRAPGTLLLRVQETTDLAYALASKASRANANSIFALRCRIARDTDTLILFWVFEKFLELEKFMR